LEKWWAGELWKENSFAELPEWMSRLEKMAEWNALYAWVSQ
jgi:hypothetical protein